MYPTLSELFRELFGIGFLPIPTFGFFVALSFIGAAYFFSRELQRKEEEGLILPSERKVLRGAPASVTELLTSAIFGFIVGFKLLYIFFNWELFYNDPRGVILSDKGSWAGGVLIAAYSALKAYRDKRKARLPEPKTEMEKVHSYDLVSNMTIIAAISGILGARIFHALENWSEFMADPSGMLFSTGGFTFYGGLIFGAIAVVWYARSYNIPPLHLIDACAPALMLAYGIGRIGCHLSGDGDWGIVNLSPLPAGLPEWLWSSSYAHNVIGEGVPIPGCSGPYCFVLPQPVYPTPLYEAIAGITLFLLLWGIRKRIRTAGVLFCLYLVLNGLERFFIEKIRVNTMYTFGSYSITQAEIISVLLIITGVAGIILLNKNKKQYAA
jgi:phosphatidylglycerol---prolipoprotein diacylglyceryl transferase